VRLARVDANGVPMGFRDIGNTPSFTTSVANTQFKHNSSRGGQSVQDFTSIIATDYGAKITLEDVSDDNLAAFVGGDVGSRTQVATPVTNELLPYLAGTRYYQLGYSNSNPAGVQGVSSVSLKINEFENAASRVNSTPYTIGQIFKSGSNIFLVTAAGTTAGSPPTFNTVTIGDATTDGGATVKWLGATGAFTVDVDYQLSADRGDVAIIAGGKIEKACTLYTAVILANTGSRGYLTGLAGYTPVAGTRVEIATTGTGQLNGALLFQADNAEGPNSRLVIPNCTIAPSGDLGWITAQNLQSFTLDIGVNQLLTTVPQIVITRATPAP
jgi:hypothetical protein